MIYRLPQNINVQTFNMMLNTNDYSMLNTDNKKIKIISHTNLKKQIQRNTKNKNISHKHKNVVPLNNNKFKDIFTNKRKFIVSQLDKDYVGRNNSDNKKFIRQKTYFQYKKPTKNLLKM